MPDAILQWIGGRDDDSIGVEQHSDKVMAAYISTRSVAGSVVGAAKGRGRNNGDNKNDKKKAGQTGNKDLSAGNTTGPNIKG